MRKEHVLFPAALAMAVVTLPGVARATSTTCATSAVCAEYINTYTSSSPVTGGVAIHGESNGGIGIRGTSVTNVGFYGASGSGMTLAPGVEGESTNTSGLDAGGGFGLGIYSLGGKVPGYGVLAYGQTYGALGLVMNPSTSASNPNAGVYAGDTSGTSSYNAALIANSYTQTGVLAESFGTPTKGIMGKLTIGLYAVAEPDSNMAIPNAIGIETESTSYPFEAYNSQNGAYVDIGHGNYLISGSTTSGSFNVTTSGDETLSGHLTTAGGTYVRKTGASGTKRIAYGAQMSAPEIEGVGEATVPNSIDISYVPMDRVNRTIHNAGRTRAAGDSRPGFAPG